MLTDALTSQDRSTATFRQRLLAAPDLASLLAAVDELAVGSDEALIVLLGERVPLQLGELATELSKRSISFSGGAFPAVLFGTERFDDAALLLCAPSRRESYTIEGLDSGTVNLDHLPHPSEFAGSEPSTAWIVVDGLTPHLGRFLEALYDRYANTICYLGGGAGATTWQQGPCLITPEGSIGHAASITFIDRPAQLGVRHGWERIAGPFLANQTEGNVIQSLNWSNPFEVYRSAVEPDLGEKLTPDNFPSAAKAYPLGMVRAVDEPVIRDPVAVTPEGGLVCVGEVSPNSHLSLMTGDPEQLISAARAAAEDAIEGVESPQACLVADCVSRVIFLGDDFERELDGVSEVVSGVVPGWQPAGALTIGEISSHGNAYLELFNKTVVIGVLY